jgi:hypothetical protein
MKVFIHYYFIKMPTRRDWLCTYIVLPIYTVGTYSYIHICFLCRTGLVELIETFSFLESSWANSYAYLQLLYILYMTMERSRKSAEMSIYRYTVQYSCVQYSLCKITSRTTYDDQSDSGLSNCIVIAKVCRTAPVYCIGKNYGGVHI